MGIQGVHILGNDLEMAMWVLIGMCVTPGLIHEGGDREST